MIALLMTMIDNDGDYDSNVDDDDSSGNDEDDNVDGDDSNCNDDDTMC